MKEKEACRFFQQIISGIEYVHKLGIVHRDLKPENLLLDKNKNIKIVDFGLSNLYKNNELLKTACGSPCYAAPEMIAGKKYVGLRVDIWSAGVILYAMICGYLPFDDPDTQLLYKKIMSGDYSIPSHVSPEGRQLIKYILNTDPEKRYTIDQIRAHPWYKLHTPNEPQGILVGYHKISIDENILGQVSNFGCDKEEVRKCLMNNKHNKQTTLYYLLMLKASKTGHLSPADVNNPNFTPELLNPVQKEERREVSQDKSPINQSRSDSVTKRREERDLSESRAAEKKKEDSLTPSRADRKPPNDYRKDVLTKPSLDYVTKTHMKIENKTRKPNLARLNNTTFDEGNQMNNKLKSPNVSVSPAPRRGRGEDVKDQREKELGTSMEIDQGSKNWSANE